MKRAIIISAITAGISASIALAATSFTVDQKGLAFSVPSLTVDRGAIVTFMNSDTMSHNILVTGEGVRLNSGLQAPGVAFRAPFSKAGTYQVGCAIHPRMKMTVTVK